MARGKGSQPQLSVPPRPPHLSRCLHIPLLRETPSGNSPVPFPLLWPAPVTPPHWRVLCVLPEVWPPPPAVTSVCLSPLLVLPCSALDDQGSNPSSSNSSQDSLHKGAKRKGIKSSIGRLFGKKEKGRLSQLSQDGAAGHGLCPSSKSESRARGRRVGSAGRPQLRGHSQARPCQLAPRGNGALPAGLPLPCP